MILTPRKNALAVAEVCRTVYGASNDTSTTPRHTHLYARDVRARARARSLAYENHDIECEARVRKCKSAFKEL